MPGSAVARLAAGSVETTPRSAETSSSSPSVCTTGVKECPAPATRTPWPRSAACRTRATTSPSSRGVADESGAKDWLPTQLVQVMRVSLTSGGPGVNGPGRVMASVGGTCDSRPMLSEVADGVWVRQSEWVWSNGVVVRVDDGLVLVDPGISGADLDELADDIDGLGLPVVAGFATHLHWDHLLWHGRFGDVPRYATAATAAAAPGVRERAQAMAEESTTGVPLDLVALVELLPAGGGPVPGTLVEHQAHAVGHAALLLADRGVLLAGDMLSDVLIPMLDPRRDGQLAAYEDALDLLEDAARHVEVVVPGHGSVAQGPEVAARLAADRAYVEALRHGSEPNDVRLEQDWLVTVHRGNVESARR